jgi:hypothetical protein
MLAVAAIGIMGYSMYLESKRRNVNTPDNGPIIQMDPYKPYMFQTIKDIIYSPQFEANEVPYIPKVRNDGVYGITQENLFMNANEPITVMYRCDNLIK